MAGQKYLQSNDFASSSQRNKQFESVDLIIKMRLSIAFLRIRGSFRTTIIYCLLPTVHVRGR